MTKEKETDTKRGERLLNLAMACHNAGREFRTDRRRNKDYAYGRQWNDIIEADGVRMTEEEYIFSQGNIPLKNNLIRRLVRNVLGVFRNRLQEQMEKWDDADRKRAEENGMTALYARTMEEFLISGMAVHRKWLGRREGIAGVWTEMVSPEAFFYDPAARDVRGADMTIVGQIHDLTLNRFCASFASSPDDYHRLSQRFKDHTHVRVAELWRSESVLRESNGTWLPDNVWRYAYISQDGEILREGDSPYRHGKHPFIFTAYPFIDGEIHSFVGDLIDQQRYTNRLITLYDWVIRASAKGVLLFPNEAIPQNANLQDIADQWSRFNGVIVYKANAGIPMPQQVSGNTMNIGIGELLDIQMKMMEDVSGVSGALQGRVESGGMSGTLYSQQTENSLTSLRDILETFDSFISDSLKAERQIISGAPVG
ncbi:MAG: hypothetical protein K2J78_09805 [Muribaculaceae bacterium]|nr:hypothetical protein [Muribaculaceae bacterium]